MGLLCSYMPSEGSRFIINYTPTVVIGKRPNVKKQLIFFFILRVENIYNFYGMRKNIFNTHILDSSLHFNCAFCEWERVSCLHYDAWSRWACRQLPFFVSMAMIVSQFPLRCIARQFYCCPEGRKWICVCAPLKLDLRARNPSVGLNNSLCQWFSNIDIYWMFLLLFVVKLEDHHRETCMLA